ncbi:unnamed protein product [Rhizophagus irregularis]|uniref:HTH lacI-type domain-containing protein n=1 Tax=Rhizophagus irregularis TaxID=588596 RepID=A0A915ZDE2_9GLOM|nr:unnamed protein product [Rhizophagus irregularis]
MTVSRVVNGKGSVRPATRASVESAIAALGYAPNAAARALAGGEEIRICLLHTNPSLTYFSDFLVGGLDQASRSNVQLVIEKCEEDGHEAATIERLLQGRIDGIALPPPLSDSPVVLAALEGHGIPVVAVATGRAPDWALSVSIDDRRAAYDMTRHLGALGHKRIGFITGDPKQTASGERLAGYRAALSDLGLAFAPELVGQGLFTYRSGLDAAERLLDLAERPTAIFASNDDMAAAAVAIAHRRGLDVPTDLTVCGFDDTVLATTIWPELTTIRQPVTEMSRTAIELLFAAARFLDHRLDEEERDTGEHGVPSIGNRQAGRHRQRREADRDRRIGDPLCKARHRQTRPANLVREHFAQHDPHDRAPAEVEEHDVEVGRDQRDHAVITRQRNPAAGRGDSGRKGIRHRRQRYRHAGRTDQQQRLAPDLVDERDREDARADRQHARQDVGLQRIILGEADRLPQRRAIIKDDIDADELLEHGEPDAGPQDRANLARGLVDQVGQARLVMVGGKARGNLGDLAIGLVGSEQLGQHRAGALGMAFDDKVARAFRDGEESQKIDRGGQRLQPEHPAPCRKAEPEVRGRAACVAREREIGDERAGQAGDDHHLLHARQAPADRRRGHFGDVHWRNHAGGTDAKATDDARDDEQDRAAGTACEQRADQEQHGGPHHHRAAAIGIRQTPRAEGTDRRADQDRADIDADAELAQFERGLQPLLGAVDNARIIAEHEAADRRHHDDRGNETYIDPLQVRLRQRCHCPSSAPYRLLYFCRMCRHARHAGVEGEQIAGLGLRRQFGGTQTLARSGRISRAQIRAAKGDLGDVGDRKAHGLDQRARRIIMPHTPAAEQRNPYAALGIGGRSIGMAFARRNLDERRGIAQRAVIPYRHAPHRPPQRIGVIKRGAIGRDRRAVGNRNRRETRIGTPTVIVPVQPTALRLLAIVHAAEPDPSGRIGRRIVQAIARHMRLGIDQRREAATSRIEPIQARLHPDDHSAAHTRQYPADFARRGPG